MTPSALRFLPSRMYLPERRSVLFLADAGCRTVRCYVTDRALGIRCDAGPGTDDPGRQLLAVFDEERGLLERLATDLFRGAPAGAASIVITAREMARAALRRPDAGNHATHDEAAPMFTSGVTQ